MGTRADYRPGIIDELGREKLDCIGKDGLTLRDVLDLYWNVVHIDGHSCWKNAYEEDEEYELDGLSPEDLDRGVIVHEYDLDDDGYPVCYAEFVEEKITEAIEADAGFTDAQLDTIVDEVVEDKLDESLITEGAGRDLIKDLAKSALAGLVGGAIGGIALGPAGVLTGAVSGMTVDLAKTITGKIVDYINTKKAAKNGNVKLKLLDIEDELSDLVGDKATDNLTDFLDKKLKAIPDSQIAEAADVDE